jgi:fumarate reductase subunit C
MKSINPWPARFDRWQSLTGLALALFIWVHLTGDSSILLGPEAFTAVGHFWEGYPLLSRPYPELTALAGIAISALLIAHAFLAMRKFPASAKQWKTIHAQAREMRHGDTTLWLVQVWTGFAMFFLAPVHLYTVIARPDEIGPVESAQRVVYDGFWALYALLILAVVPHAAIGLYRLAVKWGWLPGRNVARGRRVLRAGAWALTIAFTLLSFLALSEFIRIGLEHPPLAAGSPEVHLHPVSHR